MSFSLNGNIVLSCGIACCLEDASLQNIDAKTVVETFMELRTSVESPCKPEED